MTAFSPSTGRILTSRRFSGTIFNIEAGASCSFESSLACKTRVRKGMRFSQANWVAKAVELSSEDVMK